MKLVSLQENSVFIGNTGYILKQPGFQLLRPVNQQCHLRRLPLPPDVHMKSTPQPFMPRQHRSFRINFCCHCLILIRFQYLHCASGLTVATL